MRIMNVHSNRFLQSLCICLAACAAPALAATAPAPASEPLLTQGNLVYIGGFRVPQINSTTGATFDVGGDAIGYDAAKNGLYILGDKPFNMSAEISIPTLVNSTVINSLNTATIIQPFATPLEGKLQEINPTDPNPKYIGGQFVYDGKLIVAAYSYYDGAITQSSSHFVRPLNLSTTGQVQGPFRVGTLYPGYVGGYMTDIPTEWQSQFGGPALTGNCCVPGASWESQGPAVSVFDPATLGVTNPAPSTPLVGYPLAHALGGGWNTQNPYFNGTTQITGIVFPPGTRSVLFFGRHGTGPFCYGVGTSNLALNNQPVPGTKTIYCYDPAQQGDKGTHAYPYVYQVWAYDANNLLEVKNGSKTPDQIVPYAIWTFHLPFENTGDRHIIGGAAFDPATNRIYISQERDDVNFTPVIQVFQVTLTVPSPPTNTTAH